MKYVRKAKNTKMAGVLPDDYVTEIVDYDLFTQEHADMGGWELAEDSEAEALLQASMQPVVKEVPVLTDEQKEKIRQRLSGVLSRWQR